MNTKAQAYSFLETMEDNQRKITEHLQDTQKRLKEAAEDYQRFVQATQAQLENLAGQSTAQGHIIQNFRKEYRISQQDYSAWKIAGQKPPIDYPVEAVSDNGSGNRYDRGGVRKNPPNIRIVHGEDEEN